MDLVRGWIMEVCLFSCCCCCDRGSESWMVVLLTGNVVAGDLFYRFEAYVRGAGTYTYWGDD